jgi:hypothetical protein
MDFDLENYQQPTIMDTTLDTHTRELPTQLIIQPLAQASELTSTPGQHDIPDELLTEVRVACAQGRCNQPRERQGQWHARVCGLKRRLMDEEELADAEAFGPKEGVLACGKLVHACGAGGCESVMCVRFSVLLRGVLEVRLY